MKKWLTGILAALLCAVAILPAQNANAQVLEGYTSKVDYENIDPDRYLIDIDLVNQVLTVYERDASGWYSGIVLQGLCTTGNEENPTPAGTFQLGDMKERFGYFVAYGQYAQYWTQVIRGIYIHSVMYDSTKLSSMSKSAYNGLGKALSHGCVRTMPEHAKWIFYNCPPGTTCMISDTRDPDPELVNMLKEQKVSYKNYKQPQDQRPNPQIKTATVAIDNVPLRTGFSASKDETVATLDRGDQLKVLQISRDWCKVKTAKGKLGYIKTQYLKFDPDAPNQVVTTYTASNTTYLYAQMDTGSDRLYKYAKGEDLRVIAQVDRYWYTAVVDGVAGYVRAKYTKVTEQLQYPSLEETIVINADGSTSSYNAHIKPNIVANVRSGPGTGYDVVFELAGGTPVKLLEMSGKTGNWYLMEYNGMQAYISATCVDIS